MDRRYDFELALGQRVLGSGAEQVTPHCERGHAGGIEHLGLVM